MPTPVFINTGEGAPSNGAVVTQGVGGNSGAGSGDFFDIVTQGGTGNSIVFSTTAKRHGAYGYLFTRTTAVQQNFQKTLAADIADFVGQHWMLINVQPGANSQLVRGYSDAGGTIAAWQAGLSNTGKLLVLAGSTTVHTGTDTVAANQWVRWEYEAIGGTSIRVVLYAGDTQTVLADSGVIASSLVGVTRTFRIGLLTANAAPSSMYLDSIKIGSGPGMFGLAATSVPTSLISNPGAYTPSGDPTLWGALADVELTPTTPGSWAESIAGPTGTQFTVGFTVGVLPNGGLTIERWDFQDVPSPIIDSKLDILVGGVVVGTNTVALTTTPTKTTFTIASVTGDLSTLQARYTDTTR